MADMGIGETMLLGSAIGGVGSAATGNDPLKGALLGGALGGIGAGIAGAGAAGTGAVGASTVAPAATTSAGIGAFGAPVDLAQEEFLAGQANAANQAALAAGQFSPEAGIATQAQAASDAAAANLGTNAAYSATAPVGAGSQLLPQWFYNADRSLNMMKVAGVGGAGILGGSLLMGKGNNYLPPYTPPSAASYGLGSTLGPNYRAVRPMAEGGITNLSAGGLEAAGETGLQAINQTPSQQSTSPTLQDLASQYNVSLPTSLQSTNLATGGIASLGSYSDGGQLLKGPGTGISDDIPASIGNKQPARLANNEFVIPARIVSEIGQGSTDAGARALYKMMDRVQNARKKTMGKGNFSKNSHAEKELDRL